MSDYAVVAPCEDDQVIHHHHHHYHFYWLCLLLTVGIFTGVVLTLSPYTPCLEEEKMMSRFVASSPPACDITVTVLITGITGLIGSHVARSLLMTKPCYVVYGLVRSRSDLSNLIGLLAGLHLVEGDITDPYRMTQLIHDIQPQYVYHFAAQAINSVSYSQPESTTEVNVQGTLHLLEAIKQSNLTACRFFFAGSSTEYGRTADTWQGAALPETAPLDPVSPYGVSKVAAEALVRQYWLSAPHIPQIVVGRFFIHIGVGGTASLAIQQFAQQIAMAELGLAEPVLHHGDLSTWRDITDVRDSAPFIVQVMETGIVGEAYNIGSGVLTSMQSLLSEIIHMSRVEIETRVDTARYRAYDEKSLVADVTKLTALTGQRPHFHPTSSLRRILDHWRDKVARLYDAAAASKPQQPLSLLVPLDSCPFGNVDLFIVVVERDFPILAHLLLSIDVFMPCYGYLHIITDTLQDELKLRTWMRIHERVVFHRMGAPDNLKHILGYILQAWKANWLDKLAMPSADYVMIMDTDVLFTLPVTCRSLFDEEGRPYLGSWSIQSQVQFVPPCEEMVGNCTRSWMAFFPMLFDIRIFAPARQHTITKLEQTYNTSFHGNFDDAFAMWIERTRDYKSYSQYVNLGNYNYHYQPDLGHFIHFPHVKDLQVHTDEAAWYIPPAIHYSWRYCLYLDSCVSNPGNPGTSFPGYSGKYGDKTIQLMQTLLHEGNCLKEALSGKPPPPGCTPEMAMTIHVDARAYQGLEPNLTHIQRLYRPEILPMGHCVSHPRPPPSAALPPDHCPFGNIDIFIITIQRDKPILAHLLHSLNLFMPCYGYLHIITDTLDDELQLRAWMKIDDRVVFHRMDPPPSLRELEGVVLQAWKAQWLDQLAKPTAEYLMVLDTDVVFSLPVTCASLFDERGRPYMGYWSFDLNQQWIRTCDELVGDCVGSFMAFFPMLMDIRIFAPARQHTVARLEKTYSVSFPGGFDEAFASWRKRTVDTRYSQFVNLGNYIYNYHPELTHVIYYPMLQDLHPDVDEAALYVPPALHYGWRYCGFLRSCVIDPGVPGKGMPAFSGKYGDRTVAMIETVMHEGHCLQEFLRGTLAPGCTHEMATTIPVQARAYHGISPNLSYVRKMFTPATVPSQCVFLA